MIPPETTGKPLRWVTLATELSSLQSRNCYCGAATVVKSFPLPVLKAWLKIKILVLFSCIACRLSLKSEAWRSQAKQFLISLLLSFIVAKPFPVKVCCKYAWLNVFNKFLACRLSLKGERPDGAVGAEAIPHPTLIRSIPDIPSDQPPHCKVYSVQCFNFDI